MAAPAWLTPRWLSARRLAAALLAAAALVLAVSPNPADPAKAFEQAQSEVLIAVRDLAAGRTIGLDDLRPEARPSRQLPDGVLSNSKDAVGRVVSGAVRRGEIITDRRLLGPGLSAGLDPGLVAAPIRLIDLDVAGLLRPGDRVDILAVGPDSEMADVVADDVLVLAVPLAESGRSAVFEPLGLVVVAVAQETAARLASAASASTLTATLLPP